MIPIICGMAVGLGLFVMRPTSDTVEWVRARVRPVGSGRHDVADVRVTVEAIATWAEQLRDTLSASGGLEQAIAATETLAPPSLRTDVRRLVSDLKFGELESGLRRFADSVDHPICDFVVAALIIAHRHQARDVAELLAHLAECARDESRMHLRIWVGRARLRSAIRIVKVVIVAFVAGLVVLDPAYLRPFASARGSLVLGAIVADMAGALWLLRHLARQSAEYRFIARRPGVAR